MPQLTTVVAVVVAQAETLLVEATGQLRQVRQAVPVVLAALTEAAQVGRLTVAPALLGLAGLIRAALLSQDQVEAAEDVTVLTAIQQVEQAVTTDQAVVADQLILAAWLLVQVVLAKQE